MGIRIDKCLKFILDCILEAIYGSDDKCIICKDFLEEGGLCSKCNDRLGLDFIQGCIEKQGIKVPFYCCAYYKVVIKELIIRLKYKSDFRAGEILVDSMDKMLKKVDIAYDALSFVPSSDEAFAKRGYNQSEFLCKKLANIQDVEMIDCVKLQKKKSDQIGLSGDERWENLKEVFAVKDPKAIQNKNILLIDDVMTTGATMFYCAKVLLDAGANSVKVLTVAKSTI